MIIEVIELKFCKVFDVNISWVQFFWIYSLTIFTTTGNLYKYADDNSICSYGNDVSEAKSALENAILIAVKCFKDNYMKVNQKEYQAVVSAEQGWCNWSKNLYQCKLHRAKGMCDILSFANHISSIYLSIYIKLMPDRYIFNVKNTLRMIYNDCESPY